MIALAVAREDATEVASVRMMIPGILFYTLLAVWFIWVGIGSIKARRWARALILISSWLWLICGVSGFVIILLLLPNMYDQMGESGKVPKEAVIAMEHAHLALLR